MVGKRIRAAIPQPVRHRLLLAVDRPVQLAGRLVAGRQTDLTLDDVPPNKLERRRPAELRGRPIGFGPVRILSLDPPVFLCGTSYDQFQGFAPAFGKRYGGRPAAFFVVPTWSIEDPDKIDVLVDGHHRHLSRFPEHRLAYLCNTTQETALLRDRGLAAELLNHKFTVSEEIFRPLPDAPLDFDAVYNARFVAGKRHELASLVPAVAYVTYVEDAVARQLEFLRRRRRVVSAGSGHVIVNDLRLGLPVRMSAQDVNVVLNRAAVGLLLSEVEGASYAAVEYLLAGLPVVSTPSRGGRDFYFDPETHLICEPTPEAVRDAVHEMRARNLPRERVRAITLDKVRSQRDRLRELVDLVRTQLGARPLTTGEWPPGGWPFGDITGIPWADFNAHLHRFESAGRAAFGTTPGRSSRATG